MNRNTITITLSPSAAATLKKMAVIFGMTAEEIAKDTLSAALENEEFASEYMSDLVFKTLPEAEAVIDRVRIHQGWTGDNYPRFLFRKVTGGWTRDLAKEAEQIEKTLFQEEH